MKNRERIIANLEEAIGELQGIASDLANDRGYSEEAFQVAIEHAYHHMNFAWNIRHADESRVAECSDEDFKRWSRFPVGEVVEYGSPD